MKKDKLCIAFYLGRMYLNFIERRPFDLKIGGEREASVVSLNGGAQFGGWSFMASLREAREAREKRAN